MISVSTITSASIVILFTIVTAAPNTTAIVSTTFNEIFQMTGLGCDGYRQMSQGVSDEVASKPRL